MHSSPMNTSLQQQQLETERGSFSVFTWGSASGSNPILFFLHGAGECGLTWLALCEEISSKSNSFSIAYDLRGHGTSNASGDSNDLSLDTLSLDFQAIFENLFQNSGRDVFLIGHSMGGAIVTDITTKKLVKNVKGVIVIDVVEGTAIESLHHMKAILSKRPQSFNSIEKATEWMKLDKKLPDNSLVQKYINSLLHEDQGSYKWRIDLFKSEKYWKDWFTGMSQKFLSCPTSRLLVIAGTDRLDTTLLIGQMQGKFQLKLYPNSNHYLHENDFVQLAVELNQFVERNKSFVIKRYDAKGRPVP